MRKAISIFVLLLLFFPTISGVANSQESEGFSFYEDPLLGIRLRYPSDWQQDVTDKSVSFSKTDVSNMPTIAIFTAAVDTLEPKITSLDQFVRAGVGP